MKHLRSILGGLSLIACVLSAGQSVQAKELAQDLQLPIPIRATTTNLHVEVYDAFDWAVAGAEVTVVLNGNQVVRGTTDENGEVDIKIPLDSTNIIVAASSDGTAGASAVAGPTGAYYRVQIVVQ
jgi:glycerate-2-kinase